MHLEGADLCNCCKDGLVHKCALSKESLSVTHRKMSVWPYNERNSNGSTEPCVGLVQRDSGRTVDECLTVGRRLRRLRRTVGEFLG